MRRAGRVSADSPISSRQLDQLPADEERAAGRAGVTWAMTPRREGLQVQLGGCAGALRFAFSAGDCPSSSGHSAAHSAKPRPGCGTPRRGLASNAAPGREPKRRRGARGGGFFHAPFFVESLVESCLAACTPGFLRYSLCSEGSHPRAPPPLRPRSSTRTRVGRAYRVPRA